MSARVAVFTAEQVRAAERPLLERGVPLMQRAAAALASVVREVIEAVEPRTSGALEPVSPDSTQAPLPRVLVLAGSGDNGGDALFAAARLTAVADVDALLVADRFHEAALAAAVGAGVRLVELAAVRDADGDYAVVIDGILGIGASGDPALRGTARAAVTTLLTLGRERGSRMPQVVAVDIPSGLHPDTGAADEVVLPASVTVTFGAVKAGLVRDRGPELAGDIVLVDLGIGPELGAATEGSAVVSRVIDASG